uniref:Uncharacterized protein n=1 Tax=Marseillevirus LCMAC102 TaxID=2506603 RepID=A0A481YV08_9VIRU|nr:MAG: uncharacterized protein LCMAC102_01790 [Marseillevirus LCMAC102]
MRGIYGVRRIAINDVMNQKLFDMKILGEHCCSWWPISHFFLFFILGVLFPDCDVIILLGGVLWEFFEMSWAMFEGSNFQAIESKGKKVEYSERWWAGSMKDILFNIVGFYTGKLLVKASGKRVCIPLLRNCSEIR